MSLISYLKVIVVSYVVIRSQVETTNLDTFPSDLLLGAASSAYQVEGAWNEDGKGESIWDRFTHSNPGKIMDENNGDITCDAYHKTKEDVALMKDLGLQFYRFSLSWTRILPTGFVYKINQAGISYYNTLIDELLKNNILPIVTIYHWDLPQTLQDLGGWTNPEIVNWFEEYAKVVFHHFGDRVKIWLIINEPKQICNFGYGIGFLAPGIQSDGIGSYICVHNVLKAHARAYHLYDKVYRNRQQGIVGITTEFTWYNSLNNETHEIEAAERKLQFDCGIYVNPIFHKNGDYPQVVKEYVEDRSKEEGFTKSRLLKFTDDEIKYIKGTSDFMGVNYYTSLTTMNKKHFPIEKPSEEKDTGVKLDIDTTSRTSWLEYFKSKPEGFRKVLKYVKDNYENPDIYIFENGYADFGDIEDYDRIKYYKENLKAVLDSIHLDGVKIKAYTAWSLIDAFEWMFGYTLKFGLYHVNFSDPMRTRAPKLSAKFYKRLISTRTLPNNLKDEL